jgi:hypothetical protein
MTLEYPKWPRINVYYDSSQYPSTEHVVLQMCVLFVFWVTENKSLLQQHTAAHLKLLFELINKIEE